MKNNLKNVLREQRKKVKKTQTEIAKVLHVSQRVYSDYEKGKCEPSIDTLINMAEYFQIPIDVLVGRYEVRKDTEQKEGTKN